MMTFKKIPCVAVCNPKIVLPVSACDQKGLVEFRIIEVWEAYFIDSALVTFDSSIRSFMCVPGV